MTSRRASLLLCSVAVHVLALALLIVSSAVAPGLLPSPVERLVLHLEAARAVRLIDIPLPRRASTGKAPTAATTPAPAAADTRNDAAPVVAPDTLSPDAGRETGSASTGDVAVVELSGSVVDGLGQAPVDPGPVRAPAPKDPIRLHSGITAPRKVIDAAPVYPDLARAARIEGVVILEVTLDTNGRVTGARVLRSVPLLDQAALDAVKRWAFTAARLNNEPVPVVMTVTVRFTLDK